MAEVFSAEKIDPGRLSERQRAELSGQLYQVHSQVFTGLDEKQFDHYVVNSSAKETRILLYRNRQKELVGYFGVHRFDEYIGSQLSAVFRAEVGLLPEYRQKDADLSFWLAEATRFKLLNPGTPVYFFYAPVSPSFYALVARRMRAMYPRDGASIPPATLDLMTRLAQRFGLDQAEERNPLVRKVGWVTIATDREKAFWQSTENPYVRFYMDANPKFGEGNGLLTLVPLTFTNAVLSLSNFAFHAARKRMVSRWRH